MADSMAEGMSGMAKTGSPRVPMDRAALEGLVNASADYTSGATMHPRYSQPASDPAFFPTAARPNVMNENGGARFGLKVNIAIPSLPEAGPTTANGRLIRGRGAGPATWSSQDFAGA